MARRTKKKPKNYPNVIVFDENLEGVANIFERANLSVPEIWVAVKGVKDHALAITLDERMVFFTCDRHWLTRQPPYEHGGIIFVDAANLTTDEKSKVSGSLIYAFHARHKSLDTLRNRRFRLSTEALHEVMSDASEKRIA